MLHLLPIFFSFFTILSYSSRKYNHNPLQHNFSSIIVKLLCKLCNIDYTVSKRAVNPDFAPVCVYLRIKIKFYNTVKILLFVKCILRSLKTVYN